MAAAGETVIRPFVVGRKYWQFGDAVAGAVVRANRYYLVDTAKASGAVANAHLTPLFPPHLQNLKTVVGYETSRP